eukprot:9122014-Ditylum_brightwellii.AAC.1
MQDIKEQVQQWMDKGDQVFLMGDFNEFILKNSMVTFFANLGMRELITQRHGQHGPATSQANTSRQAIDGIW